MDRRFRQGQYGDKFKVPPAPSAPTQEEPQDWWQQPGFDEYIDSLQQQLPKQEAPSAGPDFFTRWYYEPETQEITEEQTSFPLFYRAETRGLTTERTSIPAVQSVMSQVAKDFDPLILGAEIAQKDPRRGRGFDPATYKAAGIEDPTKTLSATELHVLSGGTFEGGPDRITPEAIEAIQDAMMGPEVLRARAEAEVNLEDVRKEIADHVATAEGPPGDLTFESDKYIDTMFSLTEKQREAEAEIKRFEDIEKGVEEIVPDLPVFLVQDDGTVMPRKITQGNNPLEGDNPIADWFRGMRNFNMNAFSNSPGWEVLFRGFRMGIQQIASDIGKFFSPISATIAMEKYIERRPAGIEDLPPIYAQMRALGGADVLPTYIEEEIEHKMQEGEPLDYYDELRYNATTWAQFVAIEWLEEDDALEKHVIPYNRAMALLKKDIKDEGPTTREVAGMELIARRVSPGGLGLEEIQAELETRENRWTALPEEIQQEIDGQIARQERFRTDFEVDEGWLARGTEQARQKLQELYREQMDLARKDARFNDYTWRYTEGFGPENFSNYQDLVVVALADATLQMGRPLEPQEIERITEIYSDPVTEFIGEVTFDFFNLIPAKLASAMFIEPIKGAIKAPGFVLDVLAHADDPAKMFGRTAGARSWVATGARNTTKAFRASAIASRGHQLTARTTEFMYNFARTSQDVGTFMDDLSRLLTGKFDPSDYSKFRLSARQVDHILGQKGIVKALELGEPDELIRLIALAADDVQAKRLQELIAAQNFPIGYNPTAQELKELQDAAILYATRTENVLPTLTDDIFQKYMQEQGQLFRGGPLKDSVLSYIAEKAGVLEGKESTRALIRNYLSFVGKVRGAWASCILTARPGFTVINFLDSTFRAVVHGGNIFDTIADLSKMVPYFPEEIPGGFMRAMIGELTDIGHLLITGKAPASLPEVFRLTAAKGNGPVGKFLAGMKGMNSYLETGLRMRVYAPIFAEEWPKILNLIATRMDDLGVLSDGLVREVFEELLGTAPYHPERTVEYINTMLSGKIDQARPGITTFYDRNTYKALAEQIGGPRASVALNSVAQSMIDELAEFGVISDDAVKRILNEAREEVLGAERATFKRQSEFIGVDGGFDTLKKPVGSLADDIETVQPQRPLDEISKMQETNIEATRVSAQGEEIDSALTYHEDGIANRVEEIVEELKAAGETAMPESGATHFRANLERWREGGGDFGGSYRGLGVDAEIRQALDEMTRALEITEDELAAALLAEGAPPSGAVTFTGDAKYLENIVEVPSRQLGGEGLEVVEPVMEEMTFGDVIAEYNESIDYMYSDPLAKVETEAFAADDVYSRKYMLTRQDDLMEAMKGREFIEIEEGVLVKSKLSGRGIKQDMIVRVRSGAGSEWGAGTVVGFHEEGGKKYALVKFGDEAADLRPNLVPIGNLEEVSAEALEAAGFLSKAKINEFGVSPAQLDLDEAFEMGTQHPVSPASPDLGANEGQLFIREKFSVSHTDHTGKIIAKRIDKRTVDGLLEHQVLFTDGTRAWIPDAHLGVKIGVGDVELAGTIRAQHVIDRTGAALPEDAVRSMILHPERKVIDPTLTDEIVDSARVLRGELPEYAARDIRPDWHRELTQGPKTLSGKLTREEADIVLKEILNIIEEGRPLPEGFTVGDKKITKKTIERFIYGDPNKPERFNLSQLLTDRMSEGSPYTKWLMGGTDEEVEALLRARGYGQSLDEFLEGTGSELSRMQAREERILKKVEDAFEEVDVPTEYLPDDAKPIEVDPEREKLQDAYENLQEEKQGLLDAPEVDGEAVKEIDTRIAEMERAFKEDAVLMPETVFDDALEHEGAALEKKLEAEIEELYGVSRIDAVKKRLGIQPEGLPAWQERIEGVLEKHKAMGRQFAHSTRKFGDTKSFLIDMIARRDEPAIAFAIEAGGYTLDDMVNSLAYLEYLDDIQGIATGQGMFDFLTKKYLGLAEGMNAEIRHGRFEMYYLIREHMGIWKSDLYDEAYDLVRAGKLDVLAKKFAGGNLASYEDVFVAGGFRFRFEDETLTGVGNVFGQNFKRNNALKWDVRPSMLSDLQLQLGAIGKTEIQAPIQRTGTYIDELYANSGIPRIPRSTLRSKVKFPENIVITEDPRLVERGITHVDEFGRPVVEDEILDASWDTIKTKRRTNANQKQDLSLNSMHSRRKKPVLDTPDNYFTFLNDEIRIARRAGNYEKVKLLEWRSAQVQQELEVMNAIYGIDTPKYLLPDEGMLPKGLRQYLAEGTATMDRQGAVMNAYDEMEGFLIGTKKSQRGLDSVFMQEHEIDSATEALLIRLRNEMSKMQVEGIEAVNYGTGHLPGNNWYGYTTEGAVSQTNHAMLNYNEFTPADQFMKNNIFPFWMFPSRSLPMWLEAMAMHPEIATFYFRYMDLSERTMYRSGFITSDGRQLPSSRGFIRIPGTDGLAVNILSPLSFRYAIPDYDEYYDAFHHLTPMQKISHRTINSLTLFGLTPSPVITIAAYNWGVLDENVRPKWSIIPQTAMVPPNWQRGIMSVMRATIYPNAPEKWTPDVSWKTYLIEDLVRQNAWQDIQETSDFDEQMKIAKAAESAVQNKVDGTVQDRDLWLETRAEFENGELWRGLGGYMTGFYTKQFTDAKAEAILSRLNTNTIAWSVNNLLGAEIMGMDIEAEQRVADYRTKRYETPEGYLHTLGNTISYVRTEAGDPAYGPERDEIVAQDITEEIVTRDYWEQVGVFQEERDTALAALPEGSPGFKRSEIYDTYYTQFGELETVEQYNVANRPWYAGHTPARVLMADIENIFFYTAMSALEPYDDTKEEYLDYKSRREEFIAMELPLIVEGSKPLWEKLNSLQYIDPTVNGVDAIGARLLEIANPEGHEKWDLENDTLDMALFKVFDDFYLTEYFEAVDGKEHEAFDMAARDFYNEWRENPINKTDGMGPSEADFLGWMREVYGDKWTDKEILKAINPEVYDVEDRLFAQRAHKKGEDFARAEEEAWDVYGSIPPGSHDEFRNEFKDAGGDERFLDALTNKDVEFVDAEALEKNMPAMREAQASLGLTTRDDLPTEKLEERMQVRQDNEDYHSFVEASTYPGFWEEYSTYQDRSYAWQKTYRDTNERFAEMLKLVPDLKKEFALTHPIWAEYYSVKTGDATSGGGGGGGGGSKAYSPTSSRTTAAKRPALRDIRFGKRSTMDASYLLKPGQLGRGGTTGRLVWPPKLAQAAGESLVEDVNDLKNDNVPLTKSDKTLLQSLFEKFPEYKEFISEIDRMDEFANREKPYGAGPGGAG